MGDVVTHGITLDLASDGEDLVLTLDLDADQGVEAGLRVEHRIERLVIDRDRQRIETAAVDDCRNQPGTAQTARGARASLRSRLGVKCHLVHDPCISCCDRSRARVAPLRRPGVGRPTGRPEYVVIMAETG